MTVNELALFAGAGGGILAGQQLGWRTVCAVEIEPYAAGVLLARQNDGILPPFPIWDDVRTFDGRPWRGVVDVVSGGFPCQDISVAGSGAGIDGARSGLWAEFSRIICEVRPRVVFVENSPALTSRGLGRVLGDLAAMGFDAEWGVLGADDTAFSAGTPAVYHGRRRIWIVAARPDADGLRELQPPGGVEEFGRRPGHVCETPSGTNADPNLQRRKKKHAAAEPGQPRQPRQHSRRVAQIWDDAWWAAEPDVGRVADGVAARVDRIKALGNGQVPQCAAAAFRLLSARLDDR